MRCAYEVLALRFVALLRQPILNQKPRHPNKLANVIRHERCAVFQGGSCDQQVVRADRCACRCKIAAQVCGAFRDGAGKCNEGTAARRLSMSGQLFTNGLRAKP